MQHLLLSKKLALVCFAEVVETRNEIALITFSNCFYELPCMFPSLYLAKGLQHWFYWCRLLLFGAWTSTKEYFGVVSSSASWLLASSVSMRAQTIASSLIPLTCIFPYTFLYNTDELTAVLISCQNIIFLYYVKCILRGLKYDEIWFKDSI